MPGRGSQAMVVVSSPGLRNALMALAKGSGLMCTAYEQADEALAALVVGPVPRLLLAQDDLPGTSGARLRELLATAMPGLAVVVVAEGDTRAPDVLRWPEDQEPLAARLAQAAAAGAAAVRASEIRVLVPEQCSLNMLLAESRDLTAALPIGLLQTTIDGRVLAVNGVCVEIVRCPEDQIEAYFGRGIRAMYADDRDRQRLADELAARGGVHHWPLRLVRYDGTSVWVSINAHLRRGRNGKPDRINASLLDVTAQHESTMALELDLALERVRSEVLAMRDETDWWDVVRAFEQSMRGLLSFQCCSVNLLDPDHEQVRLFICPPLVVGRCFKTSAIHPALTLAAETGQALIRNRGDELFDERVVPEVNCILDVPFDGGTVALNSTSYNAFGAREVAILERFAKVLTAGHRRLSDMQARARAEAENLRTKERYEELVRRIPVGVYVYRVAASGEHELDYVSPQLARMSGVDIDQMQGDASLAFGMIHPEDLPGFVHHTLECAAALTPFRWAGRAIAHGQTRYIRVESDPTVLPDGDSIWSGIVIDVTEQRVATEALGASLERIRALVDANPDTFFVLSTDGLILDAKTDRPDHLLAPPSYFVGKHIGEVLPADVAILAAAKMAEARRSSEPVQFDYGLDFPSGRHEFECRLVRLGDDGLMAVIRDVTQRRQAEAERERLMVAIEQAAETVVITDAEGTIQYANPMFERVSGYTREEAIGQTPRLLKSGQQDDETYRVLWHTIASGGTWVGRLVNRRRDGTLFTEEVTISPVRNHEGVITNYVAVKRDISAQLSLEAQLAQAQKMESVGRLAGGVAHDFNNMLGVILGHAEHVLQRMDSASPLRADLDEIRNAALRSADLTRQLLAFARQQAIAPRLLDLNRAVGGVLRMLERLIGEHIELRWAPADDLWPVRVDPSQIDQILANLCVNARDAISGTGRVTIETRNRVLTDAPAGADLAPGDYVELSVADDGSGMDEHTVARIFEPFFTTKVVGEGTGLGLATVYGAVRQNDGVIRVESEPGRGTTFRIYLPRHAAEPAAAPAPSEVTELPHGEGTVLLVEDEPSILRMAERMLELVGYTVIAAPSPSDALRLATEHDGPVDLVITDVVMPEMNGPQLVAELRGARPEVRALFMSGHTADTVANHGVLDGDVEFIAKPFTTLDLVAAVGRLVGS
ncbi:MAG: PAS domain S-box protein [Armatimonadetes bacterium]|nr:PAS domain S-box protein [Armatimonadota bacterium]